jgi:adenosylcobinamide-phosphate synthase
MFSYLPFVLLAGALLDVLVKDPPNLYHPVQALAALAHRFERLCRSELPDRLRLAGIFFISGMLLAVLLILGTAYYLLALLHPLLAVVCSLYLTASLLAYGSLVRELRAVYTALEASELDSARARAQGLVSRDLSSADRQHVLAAAIESGTENASDGILAPLFYYMLGGPIATALYKTINTLDSLVGYRTEYYYHFGWATARLDDCANYVPARITGALFVLIALLQSDDAYGARRAWRRDARTGPSPNGGIPIVTFAGARAISLGAIAADGSENNAVPAVGGDNTPTTQDLQELLTYIQLMTATAVLAGVLWHAALAALLNGIV